MVPSKRKRITSSIEVRKIDIALNKAISLGKDVSYFFYKLGKVKPVLFPTGGGSQFFWQGKNYSMSLLFCITSKATSGD